MVEKVSICIPVYNNADVIGATIDAILHQTYKNIELVIVDDASSDNSCEVIESYRDGRIKLYRNKQNLGMTGNWNRCVELASAEFIKLVCADDILRPKCIETELSALTASGEAVMTVSDSIMINRKKKKLGIFRRYYKRGMVEGRKIARKSIIFSNFFGMPCAVMFRKAIFEQAGGFDNRFRYILDFDLWIAMAMRGKVIVLPTPLNYFMLRRDSNTGKVLCGNSREYYNEHVKLIDKYAKKLQLNRFEIWFSKLFRKVRNKVYGIWLGHILKK